MSAVSGIQGKAYELDWLTAKDLNCDLAPDVRPISSSHTVLRASASERSQVMVAHTIISGQCRRTVCES